PGAEDHRRRRQHRSANRPAHLFPQAFVLLGAVDCSRPVMRRPFVHGAVFGRRTAMTLIIFGTERNNSRLRSVNGTFTSESARSSRLFSLDPGSRTETAAGTIYPDVADHALFRRPVARLRHPPGGP